MNVRIRVARVGAAIALAIALGSACGSRTGLFTSTSSELPPASAEFCSITEYSTGGKDLAIYVLLDRSESMTDDNKWGQATAALGAFVNDPSSAGVGVGLQYFPLGFSCDVASYVVPAVPIAVLPGNAAAIEASLAAQKVQGETPTLPALRGAIEYARALMIAEPSRRAVIALVTDGAPQGCDSTTSSVAELAGEGASGSPQILTFAIGLRQGFVGDLDAIAAKGGTGKPILVSDGPQGGQELVDALRELRAGLASCRVAVPAVTGAVPKASDVRVAYRLDPKAPLSSVAPVAGPSACATTSGGYFVNDEVTEIELCPTLCQLMQTSAGSQVVVAAGCGGSFDAGLPPPPLDGGECGGIVNFTCVTACGSAQHQNPTCIGSIWQCPPGTLSNLMCSTCSAVPHACCHPDGTLSDASCIDGAWICPPGAILYGSGACMAPNVCAKSLPCAIGQYCESPNSTCGTGLLAGHCVEIPQNCGSAGPPVCACNGQTYPSACEAHALGLDVDAVDACPAPPGKFACGPVFCEITTEICRDTSVSGSAGLLDSYACIPKPAGCATGCKCSLCPPCPPGKVCLESCKQEPTGGNILTCSQL